MTRIDGALALVTGAGSGIGRATSLELARRGARVLAVDLRGSAAKATASECHGPSESFEADVSDRSAMQELADRVLGDHGSPDVLVNNAGVGMTGRFLDMSPYDWDWIVGVNLMGVVNSCRVFGPDMVRRGSGHVVNVSSGLAFTPRATEPAYVATKSAVLALSQCLRADWGPAGVGVSAICPGVINTPIVEHTRYLGDRSRPEHMVNIRRIFSRGHPPEKVASAILEAIEHNRPVVTVGPEASLGRLLHRTLPSRVVDRMARASPRGI